MDSLKEKYTVVEASTMPAPTKNVVALTPHDIYVQSIKDSGTLIAFRTKKDGEGRPTSLRLSSSPQNLYEIIPHDVAVYGAPQHYLDLKQFGYGPYDAEHPPIIVAGIVAPHIPKWYMGTVLVPDTGPGSAIRDESGAILAVRRLYHVPRENRT